jgi:hypothetical protein
MFIEGLITYNDIFPAAGLHTTKFCYQLTANTSEDNKIIPSYLFCDHWNCADAECDEDRKNYDQEILEGSGRRENYLPRTSKPKPYSAKITVIAGWTHLIAPA